MKKVFRTLVCMTAMAAFGSFTACSDDDSDNNPITDNPVVKPDVDFYGLTASNGLVKYNATDSATPISTLSVTGLQASETLLAIDFRPGTGQLYGLGSTSRLYIINQNTGAATAVGAGPFTPAVTGSLVGFDFNPTVDRIRLVTSSGQNLRLNPETGTVAFTDGNLNPGTPNIGSAAYSNNYSGASSTELFVVDFSTATLYKQNPPNDGTLVSVGSLQLATPPTADGGFDIAANDGVALASFGTASQSKLYQMDLISGKATELGALSTPIIGLAIQSSPVAYAVDGSNNLMIFNPMAPGTPVSKAITNLQASETIFGIDMRPVNGQLYALGSTGRLYTINTASGAAAAVGILPLSLNGTDFGFDFNPAVDRIRIVSNTGQNLRVNPNDGLLSATDTSLSPGTPNVTAAAYLNNFPGTTATTLFDIDTTTDMLYKQDPPNNGTLVALGALGVDAIASNGFDIGGTSNTGYAILTVGSATSIYSINTTTGTATLITPFPAQVKGFAVGLGF